MDCEQKWKCHFQPKAVKNKTSFSISAQPERPHRVPIEEDNLTWISLWNKQEISFYAKSLRFGSLSLSEVETIWIWLMQYWTVPLQLYVSVHFHKVTFKPYHCKPLIKTHEHLYGIIIFFLCHSLKKGNKNICHKQVNLSPQMNFSLIFLWDIDNWNYW